MAAPYPTLFKNATIISYVPGTKSLKTLRNASLLVRDGKVEALSEGEIPGVPAEVESIDATNKIICPGFVDTHHHMWQSAYRGIAADTTLQEYFVRYGQTSPASKHYTVDDVHVGQLAAALELIDCGTTTVLDHAHGTFSDDHIDATLNATGVSGLRVFYAYAISPQTIGGYTFDQSLAKFKSLLSDPRFSSNSGSRVKLGLAWDGFAFAPQEVSSAIVSLIAEHNNSLTDARDSPSPLSVVTMHFVAGPYPGNNSPTLLNSLPTSIIRQSSFQKKVPVVLSHCSFLSEEDAVVLRQNPHTSISTTPESEMHYGHTSTGADTCQDCASLGIDTHFTFSSYMPFQARIWLQWLRSKHYSETVVDNGKIPVKTPMSVEEAFLLATQKGGEALGRDDLGVIRVGAQADLVVFDQTSRPGLWGCSDPVAAVILHSGSGGDVESVMVGGRWLKRGHKIVSPLTGASGADSTSRDQAERGINDELRVENIRSRFEDSASRIQQVCKGIERPLFPVGETAGPGPAKFGSCQQINVKREPL